MKIKKEFKNVKSVAFLGGAEIIKPDSLEFAAAKLVAKELAMKGVEIYHGGGPGIMLAANEGAEEGGGFTVGVTIDPHFNPSHNFEGKDPNNCFDFEIKEVDYFERTRRLLMNTDIHLFFKGGLGTLSELAMSWEKSWLYGSKSSPIILYGKHWKDLMDSISRTMIMRQDGEALYEIVDTPEEVIAIIKAYDRVEQG